jgi:hypothetical protein
LGWNQPIAYTSADPTNLELQQYTTNNPNNFTVSLYSQKESSSKIIDLNPKNANNITDTKYLGRHKSSQK